MPTELQARRTESGALEFAIYRIDDGYRIVAPGIATYDIDGAGTHIDTKREGGTEDEVQSFCHYRIAPLLQQLRGAPCFHGGGVVAYGSAIAFLGRSGAGKSTLVASFGQRFPILGDDSVRVEIAPDGPIAFPGDHRIRLWEDSRQHFAADQRPTYFYGKAEIHVELAQGPAPLRAIYLPEMAGDEVSIARLGKRDALVSLASHGYRLDPTSRDLLEKEVAFFEAVVDRVPVATLRYPRSFERIGEVHAAILQDLDRMDESAQPTPRL